MGNISIIVDSAYALSNVFAPAFWDSVCSPVYETLSIKSSVILEHFIRILNYVLLDQIKLYRKKIKNKLADCFTLDQHCVNQNSIFKKKFREGNFFVKQIDVEHSRSTLLEISWKIGKKPFFFEGWNFYEEKSQLGLGKSFKYKPFFHSLKVFPNLVCETSMVPVSSDVDCSNTYLIISLKAICRKIIICMYGITALRACSILLLFFYRFISIYTLSAVELAMCEI
ncbi:hypothetical protein BY996DRAFT_4044243 [Phakopsora pachyrhizi]|nr:hypothetical protein BY996DRAFT_4044243 [Phakopsora pachyrhizi]